MPTFGWPLFLLICVQAGLPSQPTIPFGGTDFKQYYASSKLILSGMNPYDRHLVWNTQRPLGIDKEIDVQVPYGPPTSLLPFIAFGWLDFASAVQIHLILNVILLVVSGFFWSQLLFPDRTILTWMTAVAVVAWLPDILLCGIGQVTTWTLFGFSGWLLLMKRGKSGWAGFFLALTIVKPHLALLPILYALISSHRQPRFLLSFFGAILAMAAITCIIRPTIWSDYLASLSLSNPTQWFNATLDGWGRLHLGPWFRGVSIAVGVLLAMWTCLLAWKKAPSARAGILVLILSLCAIPYSFSYDFILLLPAFVHALGRIFVGRESTRWLILGGWVLLDVYYYFIKSHASVLRHESDFFWLPWGALALTLWQFASLPQCAVATNPTIASEK